MDADMVYARLTDRILEWDEEAKSAGDKLRALLPIAPTDEEARSIKECSESLSSSARAQLSSVERMLAVLAEIPRVRVRIQLLVFRQDFNALITDLQREINIIHHAILQTRGSRKLRDVLRLILSIGNILNGGTKKWISVWISSRHLTSACQHQNDHTTQLSPRPLPCQSHSFLFLFFAYHDVFFRYRPCLFFVFVVVSSVLILLVFIFGTVGVVQ